MPTTLGTWALVLGQRAELLLCILWMKPINALVIQCQLTMNIAAPLILF